MIQNDNTIIRQAAIDIVRSECRCGEQMDLIEELKALPSVTPKPEQRWISVSERLPEEKGEYLVTYHPCYWDNVHSELKVGIDSFRGKTTWAKKKYQRVIAWCELPEPYKERREG